jgi:calcineurin-like phosphoesterase family protein
MIITPYTHREFLSLSNAVFLAGPCPREDYEDDWRKEAIEILNEIGFKGDIINPTNPEYDGDLTTQTIWEYKGLHLASHILFWIPRNKKHPAFTTNIEFGEWMDKPNVVIGFPPESERNDYLRERLKMLSKPVYSTLRDICMKVLDNSISPAKTYFTSDTHFSAQRTLELSYRPFINVEEMDLKMISNWNKRVSMNDEVVHLGDFGNPEIIKLLNFKKMYFLSGNYERKDKSIVDKLLEDDRVVLIDDKSKKVEINNKEYWICHEPLNDMGEDKFYLYGHIHRLQMVKRNGINVGIDANRFMPMSTFEIDFLRGGIDNHFDENVFSDKCF